MNLFIPSVLDWKEKGITLIQNTAFPEDDRIEIVVGEASGEKAGILLRYPGWSGTPSVAVNGKKVRIDQEQGLSLRLEPVPGDPSKAAVLYGPVVLAGQLGTEGMVPPAPFSDPEKYNDYYTYDYHVPENVPSVLEIPQGNPEKAVEHISGLGFRTREGILLKPLYDTHHRRYIVYWNVVGK